MGGWKAALTGRLESLPYTGAKQIRLRHSCLGLNIYWPNRSAGSARS
jgi:hypothetical protein